MNADKDRITDLLHDVEAGDQRAASDLLPLVYQELRRLAGARMKRLPPGQTLQPTALVHEVYVDLIGKKDPGWKGRAHFFGAASRAMRELLIDQARRKAARKRGGDLQRVGSAHEHLLVATPEPVEDILALDVALNRLNEQHPRKAEVVQLRYFGGFTHEEIAEMLNTTVRTIERDWRFARAWLRTELDEEQG